MDKVFEWISNPIISSILLFVYGILLLGILSSFIIRRIKNKPSYKKYFYRTISMSAVYAVVFVVLIFFIVVICRIDRLYSRYSNLPRNELTDIEITLADMQANTMVICTLAVTTAGLVLTLLTLYKERKNEINERVIQDNIRKIAEAEEAIKGLSNIVSITFVNEKQREVYYDVAKQFVNNNDKTSTFYNHFRIALISITDYILDSKKDEINNIKEYDLIISAAKEIINNSDDLSIEAQFAYLEALHALYQKIKHTVQLNPANTADDIKLAHYYLRKVSGSIDDTFGHISNLTGLIELWTGIALIRNKEKDKGKRSLEKSLINFDDAIIKNTSKLEFYNHKSVALQQLYDITHEDRIHDELIEIYEFVIGKSRKYYKTYLNYAGTIIRDIKYEMGLQMLDSFPDFSKYMRNQEDEYYKMLCTKIDNAIDKLTNVQAIAPDFINGYYKMIEALTIKILLLRILGDSNVLPLIENVRRNIYKAHGISTISIPCLYCEYAFHMLIGEVATAESIKMHILNIKGKS